MLLTSCSINTNIGSNRRVTTGNSEFDQLLQNANEGHYRHSEDP